MWIIENVLLQLKYNIYIYYTFLLIFSLPNSFLGFESKKKMSGVVKNIIVERRVVFCAKSRGIHFGPTPPRRMELGLPQPLCKGDPCCLQASSQWAKGPPSKLWGRGLCYMNDITLVLKCDFKLQRAVTCCSSFIVFQISNVLVVAQVSGLLLLYP